MVNQPILSMVVIRRVEEAIAGEALAAFKGLRGGIRPASKPAWAYLKEWNPSAAPGYVGRAFVGASATALGELDEPDVLCIRGV